MVKHPGWLACSAVLLITTAGSTGAFAAPSKCTSSQFKASGKKFSSKATCYSKAVQKGVAVDPNCLTKAETKFTSAFGKAITKGDCLTSIDASTVETTVNSGIDQLRSTVNASAAGPSTCDAKKIKAAGKKAQGKLRASPRRSRKV